MMLFETNTDERSGEIRCLTRMVESATRRVFLGKRGKERAYKMTDPAKARGPSHLTAGPGFSILAAKGGAPGGLSSRMPRLIHRIPATGANRID